MSYGKLKDFIYELLGQGELIFSKKEAQKALGATDAALRNSIKRQVNSNRLHRLMKGYYLIIPPEYQNLGSVPPELFIDDLMEGLGLAYYVGLLSAASFYGATHQSVHIFQVGVKVPLRPITLNATTIKFYVNKHLDAMPTHRLKTDRGPLVVSSPEATCFDLMTHRIASGGLNHVVTILSELAEKVQGEALHKIAPLFTLTSSQRLGYLLEALGYSDLSFSLLKYVESKNSCQYIPLVWGAGNGEKNRKWQIIVNEEVDPDL